MADPGAAQCSVQGAVVEDAAETVGECLRRAVDAVDGFGVAEESWKLHLGCGTRCGGGQSGLSAVTGRPRRWATSVTVRAACSRSGVDRIV